MTKKPNPFERFLGQEDKLQIACFQYAQMQFKNLLIHHSPNEGKRSPFERYKIKQMGVKAGFPDFICLNAFNTEHIEPGTFSGLSVEFKAVYKNKQVNKETPQQIEWRNRLVNEGFYCAVITSFDDFKKLVDTFYKHLKK